MKVADYIVDILTEYDVTDVFGVPGGVIIELLYAFNKATSKIVPHLNYHEQMSGFAACGYAQASGGIGVAYATRGPGICNMVTCIAEAFQESLSVLFITAHGKGSAYGTRFDDNQELNIKSIVSEITKAVFVIDNIEDLKYLRTSCDIALGGRKGPVVLDFYSELWNQEMGVLTFDVENYFLEEKNESAEAIRDIGIKLQNSERPIVLIGDGIRNSIEKKAIQKVFSGLNMPVLSSRGSQDILCGIENYFGYIGSHGIRYSNFILSKSDYIISIGNRLAFPLESVSYKRYLTNVKWTIYNVIDYCS